MPEVTSFKREVIFRDGLFVEAILSYRKMFEAEGEGQLYQFTLR